jgi:serine protease
MNKRSPLAGIFGCAAMLAMIGCVANSGVTPSSEVTTQQGQAQRTVFSGPGWRYEGGVLYHVPHYMVTRQMAAESHVRRLITVGYGGGPVLVHPKAYLIFWGYGTYGDPDRVETLLKRYSRAMGGSDHNRIYTQYYMTSGSQTIHITDGRRQLGGVWDDNTNPVPAQPTGAQVAAEALAGVAHFGYNANGSYVVATPTQHSSSGFGTSWCAYHGRTFSNGKLVSYTNLPYQPDAGGNCGANIISPPSDETGTDEGVTIVEGHEYGESVTDPEPSNGWSSQYGEIGDICAWQNIQNDPFRSFSYTMQPMFSNKTQSCVQAYP